MNTRLTSLLAVLLCTTNPDVIVAADVAPLSDSVVPEADSTSEVIVLSPIAELSTSRPCPAQSREFWAERLVLLRPGMTPAEVFTLFPPCMGGYSSGGMLGSTTEITYAVDVAWALSVTFDVSGQTDRKSLSPSSRLASSGTLHPHREIFELGAPGVAAPDSETTVAVSNPVTLSFHPVEVSDGELLFATRWEDAERNPADDSTPVEYGTLYLLDPASNGQAPHQLSPTGSDLAPQVLARLARDGVLLDHDDRTFYLTLSTGIAGPLVRDDVETEVQLVNGSVVYFLHRTLPDMAGGAFSHNRSSGRWEYDRPRDVMMVADPAHNIAARPLADRLIERVVGITETTFWVVTAEPDRYLARITEQGLEPIITWNEHWIPWLTTIHLSPDGTYLAFETCDDRVRLDYREVIVVHVPTKTQSFSRSKVGAFEPGSMHQKLNMGWTGPAHLSFVDFSSIDLSGRIEDLLHCRIEFLGASDHILSAENSVSFSDAALPEEPKRDRIGYFEREFGRVYLAGRSRPVIDACDELGVMTGEITVSPSGLWSAGVKHDVPGVAFADGRRRKSRTLLPGNAGDLQWLPAANKVPEQRIQRDRFRLVPWTPAEEQ